MFTNAHKSGKVIAATLFGVALLAFALWKSPLINDPNHGIRGGDSPESLNEAYLNDDDGDGVRNWEEILLGTDPNNPDSDGDGVSDGDALAAARSMQRERGDLEEHTASTTQTDLLAREIFGAYIQSKQQGTYNDEAFDFLTAEVVNSQFAVRYAPEFTQDDLTLSEDISKNNTEHYREDFRDVIAGISAIGEYELTTYGRALETKNEAEFAKLHDAATVYEDIAQQLLATSAPQDAARPHLDLINSFSTFAKILTTMGDDPEDPILTFVATRDFIEGEDAIKAAYSQLDIYFTLKGLK